MSFGKGLIRRILTDSKKKDLSTNVSMCRLARVDTFRGCCKSLFHKASLSSWKFLFKFGRKHRGKRRNWSLRVIAPFPTVFSKDLYCKGFVWERLTSTSGCTLSVFFFQMKLQLIEKKNGILVLARSSSTCILVGLVRFEVGYFCKLFMFYNY